jgi:hypothetical protein
VLVDAAHGEDGEARGELDGAVGLDDRLATRPVAASATKITSTSLT